MLHRTVKLAYLLCVALGSLLALTSFHAFDEYQQVDASYQVRVDQPLTSGSVADVRSAVMNVAQSTNADIARFVDDVKAPDNVSHLYAIPGGGPGPVADYLKHGYDGFSRNSDVRFHPFSEIGDVDPRGYYFIWGTQEDAQALLSALREFGMDGVVADSPGLRDLPAQVGQGPLGLAGLVALMAVVVLAGAGVVMAAPGYGVLRLQGWSYSPIVIRDLREALVTVALSAGVAAASMGIGLVFYNRLARVGDFALVAGSMIGTLIGIAILTHILALALLFRAEILGAVKGDFPSRLAMISIYAVRVPAAILVAVTAFACLQSFAQVEERHLAQGEWLEAGDASYMLLSGTADMLNDPEMFPRVGSMSREAVADGAALVVSDISAKVNPSSSRSPRSPHSSSCPVILVSPSYLEVHEVLSAEGTRITAVDRDAVSILQTPRCDVGIRSGVNEWLAWHAGRSGLEPPTTTRAELESGQSIFTYGDQWDPSRSPWAHDATLVVVPPELRAINDDSYGNWTSGGDVIYLDQEDSLNRARSAGLEEQVSGMLPVGMAAAKLTRKVVTESRTNMAALVGVLGVVAATAVAVVTVHSRQRAQEIYVRHISGWHFFRSARTVLLIEFGLAAVTILWAVYQSSFLVGSRETADAIRTDAPMWYVGIAAIGAALYWICTLALIKSATIRLVRTRSSEA